MFLYFNKNGTIRGQITGPSPFRVGNKQANTIFVCFEKGSGNDFVTSAEIKFRYQDGHMTGLFGMIGVNAGEFILRPYDFTNGINTIIEPFKWNKDYARSKEVTVLKFIIPDRLIIHGDCEITIIARKGEMSPDSSYAMQKINVFIEDNINTSFPDDEVYVTIRDELDGKVNWGKQQFSIGVTREELSSGGYNNFFEYLNDILQTELEEKVTWGKQRYSIGVTKEELDSLNADNVLDYLRKTDLKEFVKKVNYDNENYIFIFTMQDGTEKEVILPFDNVYARIENNLNKINALSQSLNILDKKHNDDINRVEIKHNDDINRVEIKHNDDINRIITRHNDDINKVIIKHNNDINCVKQDISYSRIGLMVVDEYNEETGIIKFLYDPSIVRFIDYDENTGIMVVHTNPKDFNE